METIDPSQVDSWIQGIDDDVEKEGSSPKAGSQWYVVSMRWLNKWRSINHVKLSEMDVDKPEESMDIDAASAPADPCTNEIAQIGEVDSEDIIDSFENHIPSVQIKPGLTIGNEIEILPPKAWNYFKEKYGFKHEIIRYSIKILNSTKVEIYPKLVQIVYYTDKKLNECIFTFHVSVVAKKQDLEDSVLDHARIRLDLEGDFKLFLWKFLDTTDVQMIGRIVQSGKPIEARLLKDNDRIEALEIADEDIVLAELTRSSATSFREYQKANIIGQLSSNSRKGLTGLQNLGNTCFMNSGLQCLSNTHKLTEYLLSGRYSDEINKNNKISTKGRIVTAYAELVKEMWKGSSSSVSPWAVKKALGSVAQQFMGFSQQDSQEMLSYLIDGIHEDINRAPKPKPTEIDEKGKSEGELASIWWDKHLERNQSIIVDLMHGQYKSEVTCRTCNNVSLAFDPFLMLTLPIPSKESYMKDLVVIDSSQGSSGVQIRVEVKGNSKVGEALKKIPQELQPQYCIVAESDSHTKEVRRMILKGEAMEKSREYTIFKYDEVNENSALALCNFSTKMYNDNYNYGTSLGITRLFIVEKGSFKDCHLSIYKEILRITEDKVLESAELLELFKEKFPGLISNDKRDLLYTLSVYNPGRTPCPICHKETCYGCPIPFSDEPLSRLLAVSRDPALFFNIVFKGDRHLILNKVSALKYSISTLAQDQSTRAAEIKELSVRDCLQLFEEVEDLDESESIYCRNCKNHRSVSKKMNIYKLPEHLAMHLKRFKRHNYSMQKNGSLVHFPLEGLEMKQVDGQVFVYDLYAISNHYGSMGGGHYTAYCRNINGNWYDFNDSSVSEVRNPNSVITAAAYVLFYKRR